MWDFPELEIWSKNLTQLLKEKKIIDSFCSDRLLTNISISDFRNKVYGKTVKCFSRHGSSIIINLTENKYITIKPSMNAYFKLSDKNFSSETKFILNFSNFSKLLLIDPTSQSKLEFSNVMNDVIKQGSDFTKLNVNNFVEIFPKKKSCVKFFLVSDKFVLGIGNVCADEILFNAGIRPDANVLEISKKKQLELYESMFNVLSSALIFAKKDIGKTLSSSTYNWVRVFGRKNKSCYICGKRILSKKVNGIESYYCGRCQK